MSVAYSSNRFEIYRSCSPSLFAHPPSLRPCPSPVTPSQRASLLLHPSPHSSLLVMSDLIDTEEPYDPSYRRFRSEFRGKRWLAQKLLRDTHGHVKRDPPRDSSNSLCSERDLRKAELAEKRELARQEKAEKRLKTGEQRKKKNEELQAETFEGLQRTLKSFNGKEKERREASLKQYCDHMYTKKLNPTEWAEEQPKQLLRTLLKGMNVNDS